MDHQLSRTDMVALAELAVRAVEAGQVPAGDAAKTTTLRDVPNRLREHGATFVTLDLDGARLGCKGSITPERPLAVDVQRNARRAAFTTPVALSPPSLVEHLTFRVAVLSAMSPVAASSPSAVALALRPAEHGLLLTAPDRGGAVFLPMVWERMADARAYVDALAAKAGWRSWPPGVQARVFTTCEVVVAGPELRRACVASASVASGARRPSDDEQERKP